MTHEELKSLEREWNAEMLGIYRDAKAIGYDAKLFFQMLSEHGGLEAARRLIRSSAASYGFAKLYDLHRLDISVEARAQKPRFAELFSETDLSQCRKKLAEYGWTKVPPWTK